MANIKRKVLNIQPSTSPDVTAYRIRVVPAGEPVNYDTPNFQTVNQAVDVSTIPALSDANGLYDFYVSAVDQAGNESDMLSVKNVIIDFLAPSPPAGISFS